MQHPFSALEGEYTSLLAHMVVTRQREVDAVAHRLLGFVNEGKYTDVSAQLGIPQIFIATSFEREASSNFRLSPAQGDDWSRVSVHVPRGRGPFPSWMAAAVDAYKLDGLDKIGIAGWTWTRFCYEGELFNGFGYRAHGVHTPYDWAGSNDYATGKYVSDGVFDMGHADTQLGIVPVARAMVLAMPALELPGWPGAATGIVPTIPAPPLVPAPAPVGVGATVAGHDVAWLQQAFDTLGVQPPLVINGNYDRFTKAAVTAFQTQAGIDIDGIAGPKTVAAIEQLLAA